MNLADAVLKAVEEPVDFKFLYDVKVSGKKNLVKKLHIHVVGRSGHITRPHCIFHGMKQLRLMPLPLMLVYHRLPSSLQACDELPLPFQVDGID